MRVRDSKRSAAYESEDAAFGDARWAPEFTLDQAQEWVDAFTRQRWFTTRWRLGQIKVVAGRGLHGWASLGTVSLGVNARNRYVILHEIAHLIVDRETDGHASHGPEFAATYLFLLGHEFGAEQAARLRGEYAARNVKYRWSGVQREPRYEVATQAEQRARRVAKDSTPPTPRERRQAAEVLRRAVKAGQFGPAGAKPRTHALATARTLDAPE